MSDEEMAFPGFDSGAVEPTKDNFTPVPPGKGYKMMVTDIVYKSTKNGKGKGLNTTFEVVEGQYMGRKVFSWINTENDNAEAQQIGQGELSALCRAVGVKDLLNPSQLKDIPFYGTIGLDKNNKEKNVIYFGTLKSTREGKVDRETKINKNITDKFEAPAEGAAPTEFDKDQIPF